MKEESKGVAFILFASIMWALEPVLAKLSYSTSDFLHTSVVRAIVIAMVSIPYAIFTKGKFCVKAKKIPVILYIAIAGTVFADLIYFFAISKIPVINAVIIAHMQPLLVILFGFFLLDENLSKYDYGGIFSMISSAILITGKSIQNILSLRIGSFGDLMVLLATIAWATTAIAARKYLRSLNAGVITFYRFFIASLILILIAKAVRIDNVYQILVGIVVAMGTIFYYEGLKRVKAAKVAALELSSPFFASIFAFIVLHETMTALQIFGILLLFLGIYFLSKKS
ncbi:MAG: DMT family transporter [Thermoplasmata archaeon]|nr:DMT family transporter [Thermoplasmata archaeon]